MNFTREPVIETIITPKEGFKLLVRSSKAGGQEEYLVDAVEVVSFGHALFFRSLERPKSFLVPVSDYEVLEAKEARVVLKSASFEKAIKIGGGREASPRPSRESVEEEASAVEPEASGEGRSRRRRDRHRRRRREGEGREQQEPTSASTEPAEQEGGAPQEASTAVPFTTLIPPPSTLISETISRYKELIQPPPAAPSPATEPEAPQSTPSSPPAEEE